MRTVVSIDQNNYRNLIWLSNYEHGRLQKEVEVVLPRTKDANTIIVRVMSYLWIRDNENADRKVIGFKYSVNEAVIEFWNKNLELLRQVEDTMFLEFLFKDCKCSEKQCYTRFVLREIFLKELLKHVREASYDVEKRMYQEKCRVKWSMLECYKVFDLKSFR